MHCQCTLGKRGAQSAVAGQIAAASLSPLSTTVSLVLIKQTELPSLARSLALRSLSLSMTDTPFECAEGEARGSEL